MFVKVRRSTMGKIGANVSDGVSGTVSVYSTCERALVLKYNGGSLRNAHLSKEIAVLSWQDHSNRVKAMMTQSSAERLA